MKKAINAIRLFGKGRIDEFHAVEETLKMAVLSSDPEKRTRAVKDLYDGSGGNITRGFAIGGRLYLEVKVNQEKRLFCVCDMPHEYEGVKMPGAYCFETETKNEPFLAGVIKI